jgi:hypothetical protein
MSSQSLLMSSSLRLSNVTILEVPAYLAMENVVIIVFAMVILDCSIIINAIKSIGFATIVITDAIGASDFVKVRNCLKHARETGIRDYFLSNRPFFYHYHDRQIFENRGRISRDAGEHSSNCHLHSFVYVMHLEYLPSCLPGNSAGQSYLETAKTA